MILNKFVGQYSLESRHLFTRSFAFVSHVAASVAKRSRFAAKFYCLSLIT